MRKPLIAFGALMAVMLISPAPAMAMHITEGILPAPWAILWGIIALPFVLWGNGQIRLKSEQDGRFKAFVALVGSAVFIISCMPIPVPTAGTCSHPCGTGLAAILIGPGPTVVVASLALLLQALFMAHGGLSTWGANILSMGVVGAFVGAGAFAGLRRVRAPLWLAAFLGACLADWATYGMTSFELATALRGDGSFWAIWGAILIAFVPTQLPLGILEGVVSAMAYQAVVQKRPSLLRGIRGGLLKEGSQA